MLNESLEHQFLLEMESGWLEELRKEVAYLAERKKFPKLKNISLELSDATTMLGSWQADTRCISISRHLVRNFSWECVLGVLFHEMAHAYVSFWEETDARNRAIGAVYVGIKETTHGERFIAACKILNVPPHFRTPTIDVHDPGNLKGWRSESPGTQSDHSLLRKAEKLSQLSQSNNEHEAALALERLHKLRTAFNFQRALANAQNSYVRILLRPKKKALSRVYKKLGSILNEFYGVSVVFDQEFDAQTAETYKTIAVLGAKHEVLFAEYVYFSLLQQLESISREFQKEKLKLQSFKLENSSVTKSSVEKLSLDTFKYGLLVGYASKLREAEESNSQTIRNQEFGAESSEQNASSLALVKTYENKTKRELSEFQSQHYQHLRSSSSTTKITNANSFHAGVKAGENVTIHKPVTSAQSGKFLR